MAPMIITDPPSPDRLARLIDANQIELHASQGRDAGCQLVELEEACWFHTGVDSPIFNGVLRVNAGPGELGGLVARLTAWFKHRGVPMMWWTGPCSQAPGLKKVLLSRGFLHAGDQPGMALDLYSNKYPAITATNLDIRPVETSQGLPAWMTPVGQCFELASPARASLLAHLGAAGFQGPGPWRHFTAWVDQSPVAAASLFFAAGVAGIYYVATLPHARGRGLASALTTRCLDEADQQGYRYVVLQSSPRAQALYQRLGFRRYCALGRYILW